MLNFSLIYVVVFSAFAHVIVGVDHYMPIVMTAKFNRWGLRKTLLMTTLCGTIHVGVAVLIGLVFLKIGSAGSSIIFSDQVRSKLLSGLFFLSSLGLIIWGLAYHRSKRPAAEWGQKLFSLPQFLMMLFIIGPCEPALPIISLSYFQVDYLTVAAILGIFLLVTVLVMNAVVFAVYMGFDRIGVRRDFFLSPITLGSVFLFCGIFVWLGY